MAASGYTVFVTYMLSPQPLSWGYGYSQAIHCNYINKIVLDTTNPYINDISIRFQNLSDFKFLSGDITYGTGYTATNIYGIFQVVDNSNFSTLDDVKPTASAWKIQDLTSNILLHVSGNTITPTEIANTVFKISLANYNYQPTYNLSDYMTYPSTQQTADSELCFGEEYLFLGVVKTDIKAIAYTTDIPINLNLNEFNSSTNESWTKDDKVAISEIGIYDSNKNLVAIGKLNNPIVKDSTISRTIVFDIDF